MDYLVKFPQIIAVLTEDLRKFVDSICKAFLKVSNKQ